ncbi:MAG: hypothetical protein D6691_09160 [Candidatus Hydrogenedentota bacterium]|nr:MAG: hypothetical protein D6691_09160 [Candidatus Hydrogenedentota bacterium]
MMHRQTKQTTTLSPIAYFRFLSFVALFHAITWGISFLPTLAWSWNPTAGDFSKASPSDVRLMAYNTARNFISVSAADSTFSRILKAIDPDVIAFEEIRDNITTTQLVSRLNSILPLAGGQSWKVHLGKSDGTIRTVLASRTTQTLQMLDTVPASEVRGVNGALVQMPRPTYDFDLYVMAVHLKALAGGTNTQRRQKACDALAKWFGDLRTPGGAIDLPTSTPAIVMGDFNFVDPDPQQPEVTLRTGDIVDNATYGPDIKPDWDASDLFDVTPRDPYTNATYTYPNFTPPSRIDRFYLTDSVAIVKNAFILNTKSMTQTQLSAAGLDAHDTELASDHLPIVMDIWFPVPVTLSAFSIE